MGDRRPKRLVLVHPPLRGVVGAATPDYVDENRGHSPPLGLLYLQAAVERSRHESFVLDADLEGWSHYEAARQALKLEPDAIGLQAMSFTLPDAYRVARAIKAQCPEMAVILGGPHPTIFPEETVALDAVDFAFAGEGEVGIVEFLDALDEPEALSVVPGLARETRDGIAYTPSLGLLEDLDSVAYPARESSPYQRYTSVLAERSPITTMISSRGCPFRCVFCNRMGRRYRHHSADYVLGEFEAVVALGIGEVFIHDDIFTLDRERVEAICRGLIERKLDLIWEARTRVDRVDERMLELMRAAGCHRISFGVESGSEPVLQELGKGIDLERVEQVFAWCRKQGIVSLADFMVGNPGERREDINKTLALMKRIAPDFVQFSICSLYPGTPIYESALKKGLLASDVWEEFARNPLEPFHAPYWTETFSEDELRRITKAAYRQFYMRPTFILKQLGRIKSLEQFKTVARGALGILKR